MKRHREPDHCEVRCEAMAEIDLELGLFGSARTCCVCVGHDCEEARAEVAKQAKLKEAT